MQSARSCQECEVAHLYTAAQYSAWCNMHMLADAAVMVNSRAGVNDAGLTHCHVGLQNGPCHDLSTGREHGTRVDPSRRMHQYWKSKALSCKSFVDTLAYGRTPWQLANAIDELELLRRCGSKIVVVTQNSQSAPMCHAVAGQ
jgi:hypothetical protein